MIRTGFHTCAGVVEGHDAYVYLAELVSVGGGLWVCSHPKPRVSTTENNTNVLFCVRVDGILGGIRVSSTLQSSNVVVRTSGRSRPCYWRSPSHSERTRRLALVPVAPSHTRRCGSLGGYSTAVRARTAEARRVLERCMSRWVGTMLNVQHCRFGDTPLCTGRQR